MQKQQEVIIIIVFDVNSVTDSFNYKVKFAGQTGNNGTKKC